MPLINNLILKKPKQAQNPTTNTKILKYNITSHYNSFFSYYSINSSNDYVTCNTDVLQINNSKREIVSRGKREKKGEEGGE